MFVQINDKVINMDRVTDMAFHASGDVTIYQGLDELMTLTGDEAEAFKNWWNEKADVYKLPV